jgi:hypothetical protein
MKKARARKIAIALLLVTVLSVVFNRVGAAPPGGGKVVVVFAEPREGQQRSVGRCPVSRIPVYCHDANGNPIFLVAVRPESRRYITMGIEGVGNPDAGTFFHVDLPLAGSESCLGWVIENESRRVSLAIVAGMVRCWTARGVVARCRPDAADVFDIQIDGLHALNSECQHQPVFLRLCRAAAL